MEDIQQALYGGNISGRRLRGVKINPIYQENDPGSRDGQSGDTQSESALPIGEIQIEVYESLPRNCQRSFLPSYPSSSVSSPCEGKEGCSPTPSCSSVPGSDGDEKGKRGGSCSERGGCSVGGEDVLKKCPGVKGIMGVDSLPWSFLQERSPARREPVWGAFRSLENKALPGLQEDNEDGSEGKVQKKALESTPSLSSDSRNALASFEDLGINSETDSDVGINILESSGEGEPPGDFSASSGMHDHKDLSGDKSRAMHPSEYQAYFVTLNNHPNLASILAQGQFPYGTLDACSKQTNGKNGYSSVAHNDHQYSKVYSVGGNGLDNKLSDISHMSGKNGFSVQYPISARNGLKLNGVVSPEDGHVLCTCPCHSQVHVQPSTEGMAGTILTNSSEISPQNTSEKLKDSDEIHVPETPPPSADPHDSVQSESKNQEDGTREEREVHELTPQQRQDNEPILHKHSETCMQDFENNNNCLVLYTVSKQDLCPKGLDSVKPNIPIVATPTSNNSSADDSKLCPDSDGKDNVHISSGKDDKENKGNDSVLSQNDAAKTSEEDVDSQKELKKSTTDDETNQTKIDGIGKVEEELLQSICKRCGCPKVPHSDASRYARLATVTSPGLTDALMTQKDVKQGVHSLLSNDSVLLRADELDTQTYIQRYLAEAHKQYLKQLHTLQLPFDDAITTHTSPARSITNQPPAFITPCHTSDFIVPDTGELREDINFNLDTVSYIEELDCCLPKNSVAKKSFKEPSSTSKSNSGQSSHNNSRQSSRNSKGGKHCSIEDLDAELEDEEEGANEGKTGSQLGCGGSDSDDPNAKLKKSGLSIIHIGGTTCDPAFEMIVPCEDEEDSYTRRRRERLKNMQDPEDTGWKEQTSLKERLVKTAICVILFCVFVGIFVGIAIHFAKDSDDDPGSGSGNAGMISGSLYGMR